MWTKASRRRLPYKDSRETSATAELELAPEPEAFAATWAAKTEFSTSWARANCYQINIERIK